MRVLLRCDGSPQIGVGHVVRALALAEEAVSRGHTVSLLGRVEGTLLESLVHGFGPRLTLLGPEVERVPLAEVALAHDVVHVDHYELGTEVLDEVDAAAGSAGADRPLLSAMADGEFGARPADVLIDPTVGAELGAPPARARWHLRGARFTPLRAAVTDGIRSADPAASSSGILTVLVVMGGTDPTGCTPLVVEALRRLGLPLDVTVVSAPATAAALAALADTWPAGRLRVTPPVRDLPSLMAAADVTVTAAGTSTWELCALRRPMALVSTVENQRVGHDRVVAAGAGIGLGGRDDVSDVDATAERLRPLLTDADLRERLAAAAHRLVDGRGAWRVVGAWEAARSASAPRVDAPAVTVRPAGIDDARALWEWRNDPATRAASRHHSVVPLEDHLTWLRATLQRDDRHLLIGSVDGTDVGTIRWDLEGDREWEVSITVAGEARGRGMAGALLRAGEQWLAGVTDVRAYLAVVHTANEPSRRVFVSGGYAPDLPADVAGFERWVRTVR